MKAGLIMAVLLTGMSLCAPTRAEDSAASAPRYVGAITGNPEKDTFGYLAADVIPESPTSVLFSQEARYVGQQTGDEEKDTFARVQVNSAETAEVED